MRNIRKFKTVAERDAWLVSDEFVSPNVVLTEGVVEHNIDLSTLPLHIEAIEDLTISFGNTYEYSKDNSTWSSGTSETSIAASAGERVFFRASGLIPETSYGIGNFTISNGTCNVAGNVMSMAYGAYFKGKVEIPYIYQFGSLFRNATKIVDASKLILPATTLADSSYAAMFFECTSLTTAPELPATTLAKSCYSEMFRGCTSLVNAPTLPATTLAESCYHSMFRNCSNLNFIKMLATDISASDCLYNWVSKVSSTGTFVKNSAATWDVTGASGIPEGWTVEYVES